MAGDVRIERTYTEVKALCLTTWRIPNGVQFHRASVLGTLPQTASLTDKDALSL